MCHSHSPQPGSSSHLLPQPLSSPAAPQRRALWGLELTAPLDTETTQAWWHGSEAVGQWHGHITELHRMGQTPGSSLKPLCSAAPLLLTVGPAGLHPSMGRVGSTLQPGTPHTQPDAAPDQGLSAHCQPNPQPDVSQGWDGRGTHYLGRPQPHRPPVPACLGVPSFPCAQRQLCPFRVQDSPWGTVPPTCHSHPQGPCPDPAVPAQSRSWCQSAGSGQGAP